MELEVSLNLDDSQSALLEMHSVLNILNVVNYELILISSKINGHPRLDELMDRVSAAGRTLADPEKNRVVIQQIEGMIQTIEDCLDESFATLSPTKLYDLAPHRENLKTIYSVIRIRTREINERRLSPHAWVEHRVQDLQKNFVEFLSAVEQNSHGQYRIVRNIAAQEDDDYLIHFDITSDDGETLLMPIIFQDVMRDLLANARKYTPPGGIIRGGLHATRQGLRFIISDNGIGIPKESIKEVVLFGKRANNVADRPTRGGGFGLTKAYHVTRQFKGRMWIDSSTDMEGQHGTIIEIMIPTP